jgi:hypothetical protein
LALHDTGKWRIRSYWIFHPVEQILAGKVDPLAVGFAEGKQVTARQFIEAGFFESEKTRCLFGRQHLTLREA